MTFPSFKQNIPQLPELIIDRVRLLEKVQSATQRKLTLIIAPPGYGKTTLVAQFVRSTTLPVVWHSVQERERDVPNLLEHSIQALSEIIPVSKTLTGEAGNKKSSTASAVSLTEYLSSNLKTSIVYVMDDFHRLITSSASEIWLRTFLAGIPSTCHLILIGRTATSLPIVEMIAHREVEAIGQEDLRFTFQEVNDLTEKMGNKLSSKDVQKIISRLNGWPAGTILAIQPLPPEIEMMVFDGKSGPEALFESLAASIFESQPSDLNKFLLASSTLSQMTPVACQSILGLPDSLKYLKAALERNLFISQISGGMIYLPLFRTFLQKYLQTHDPEQFIQLHNQAGRWFEDNNRLEEAFDHYIIAQQGTLAAAIAERSAQSYLAQGKAETVLDWNKRLHQSDLNAPRLHYTVAMIHTDRYQYDQAEHELVKATSGFRATKDEIGLVQVALLNANIQRLKGHYQQAIEQAEGFVDRPSIPENMQGLACFILGNAYLELGNLATALQYLEATLPLWRIIGDAYSLSQLLLSLDAVYTRLGKFVEAASCVEEIVNIQRSLGKSPSLVIALNNLGYHYHLLGDYHAALSSFEEGLQILHHLPDKRSESYIQWSLGDLRRDCGGFAEAMISYQKALNLVDKHEPRLKNEILLSITTLQRWKQAYADAFVVAQEARVFAQQYNLAVDSLRAEAAVYAIRFPQESSANIPQELEKIANKFEQIQEQSHLAQTLGICAAVALQISDVWMAHKYLKRAITSINHISNLQPLVAEIIHTPILKDYVLAHAQQYKILVQEMRKLEAVQIETPTSRPQRTKNEIMQTYSLQIWALGQERIERDGKLVATAAWKAAIPRHLFFYLILNGAKSLEQIGLVFWPDSSLEEIRSVFHNVIYRARAAVGTNVILFENDRYLINPDINLWCDVFEFRGLVQQARLISPGIAHTENLLRQAVNRYKGDLLPSSDSIWLNSYRETLHEIHLEALLALANSIRVRGNIQEAIVTYKSALDVDPYREDIYRALFGCYADTGQYSLIPRQIETLTQLLKTELGIGPSAETLSLVQTLID
ncbi:MAG: tetratricopeptide repeat protein [Chloroflexota bacterium]